MFIELRLFSRSSNSTSRARHAKTFPLLKPKKNIHNDVMLTSQQTSANEGSNYFKIFKMLRNV
jgi:hypothetical protein